MIMPLQRVSYNDTVRQDKSKMATLTVLAMVVVLKLEVDEEIARKRHFEAVRSQNNLQT